MKTEMKMFFILVASSVCLFAFINCSVSKWRSIDGTTVQSSSTNPSPEAVNETSSELPSQDTITASEDNIQESSMDSQANSQDTNTSAQNGSAAASIPVSQTGPRDGDSAEFQIDTSFGKLTIVCNAYANAAANVPMFVRCRGDATAQLRTAFGANHTIPRTLVIWGYQLTLNFNTFSSSNGDSDVYSDSGCSQPHSYVVGSSMYLSTTGSFTVPRCKSGVNNLDHCMDTTQCVSLPNTPYGNLYVKNKAIGWTQVEMTYENITR